MLLDRNSSNSNKKSRGYGWITFFFIVAAVVIASLGAKDKIRTELQKFLSLPAHPSAFTKEDVETIIYDFIKQNPQVIISSLQDMQKREYEDSLKQAKITIQNKKNELQGKDSEIAPFSGNKDGDVVVISFLDYRCGYCKKVNEDLKELVKRDPKVKIIYKEHPVLGEASVKLAKTALAVYLVDPSKYVEFHNILISSRDPNDQFIQDTLKLLNIDHIKVKALMDDARIAKELASVTSLSREIGVRGTPAFIIGDELVPGAIDVNAMLDLVKAAREKTQEKK